MRRDVFQAIADPNRRAIIQLLSEKRRTLNGVAEHFDISRPAISKHIRILNECGLVDIVRQGREHYCSVKLEGLSEVSEWVNQYEAFWTSKLDALGGYLSKKKAAQSTKKHKP
jgi:DNA-binding transcriptional ArsR family regulator